MYNGEKVRKYVVVGTEFVRIRIHSSQSNTQYCWYWYCMVGLPVTGTENIIVTRVPGTYLLCFFVPLIPT